MKFVVVLSLLTQYHQVRAKKSPVDYQVKINIPIEQYRYSRWLFVWQWPIESQT